MGHIHIPLDGFHTQGAHGVDGHIVIVAIGQAHQGRTHTGDGLDLVIAGGQISGDLLSGELGIVGMGVGVVHDLVAGVVQGFHRLGVFVHPVADDEKCGRDLIFFQNVDELLGVLIAPG